MQVHCEFNFVFAFADQQLQFNASVIGASMHSSSSGSIWRKWDLHIHSPESALNNQFGDDWDLYVKTLYTKALENNVHAIGITDYFCIEGYKKIVQNYLKNDEKLMQIFDADRDKVSKIKKILLLPNIEFRLRLFVGDGNNKVNFHVIFSDEIDISIIEEHRNYGTTRSKG